MVQAVRVCVEQQEDDARRAVSRVGGGGRVPFLSGGCNQPFRFSSANGITAALFFPMPSMVSVMSCFGVLSSEVQRIY